MSFEVLWDWPALTALYRIHWRAGADVDAAVLRFAALRAATITPAPLYNLRVSGHAVVLTVDRERGTVTVLRIFRMR